MLFKYSYKTSDGERHEGKLRAKNKECVFETLRERGIKAIKVEQVGYDFVRLGFFAACSFVVLSLIITVTYFATRQKLSGEPTLLKKSDAYKTIKTRIDDLKDSMASTLSYYDIVSIDDYAGLKTPNEISKYLQKARQVKGILEYYRSCFHDAFREALGPLGESLTDKERLLLKSSYGKIIDDIELKDLRVRRSEYVLFLLKDNWGDWSVEVVDKCSKIVFKDENIQRDFDFYSEPMDSIEMRWAKDFAPVQKEVEYEW